MKGSSSSPYLRIFVGDEPLELASRKDDGWTSAPHRPWPWPHEVQPSFLFVCGASTKVCLSAGCVIAAAPPPQPERNLMWVPMQRYPAGVSTQMMEVPWVFKHLSGLSTDTSSAWNVSM